MFDPEKENIEPVVIGFAWFNLVISLMFLMWQGWKVGKSYAVYLNIYYIVFITHLNRLNLE